MQQETMQVLLDPPLHSAFPLFNFRGGGGGGGGGGGEEGLAARLVWWVWCVCAYLRTHATFVWAKHDRVGGLVLKVGL